MPAPDHRPHFIVHGQSLAGGARHYSLVIRRTSERKVV